MRHVLNRPGPSLYGAALALAALALLSCSSASSPPQNTASWNGPQEMRPSQVRRPPGVPHASLEFRLVLEQSASGATELVDSDGKRLLVAADPIATQRDITRTEVGRESFLPDQGSYVIYVHFTEDAASRLREFSSQNLNRRLAIVFDGELLLAPVILTPFDSPVMIQGTYTQADATRIAERLAP